MSKKKSIPFNAEQLAVLVEEQVGNLASSLRPDYLAALKASATKETSTRGREALEQLLANAHLAASEGLPLCQDTGYVWVCLEVAGSVSVPSDIFSEVPAAVARASKACGLRMSMLRDALVERVNTEDNTPAFCEIIFKEAPPKDKAVLNERTSAGGSVPVKDEELVKGDAHSEGRVSAKENTPASRYNNEVSEDTLTADDSLATLHVMLKGGGSDNASALAMLPPGAGVEGVMDFVVRAVAEKGANACPPLVLGVGVGGSFDKVAGLAKHALLRPVGSVHPREEVAVLEDQLLSRINALGIGPGGLGGSTTALAVHIKSAPCHIAALPVAVNIGCTALRSASILL